MSEFSKCKILNVKQNESKSRIKVCCLKQCQCLDALAAHPYPNFPWVVPPRELQQENTTLRLLDMLVEIKDL